MKVTEVHVYVCFAHKYSLLLLLQLLLRCKVTTT